MMAAIDDCVSDLVKMFDANNYVAIVVYAKRGEGEGSVNFTASVEELVDMAATAAAVATREIKSDLKLDSDSAERMVRDALGERLRILSSGERIRKPPSGGSSN